MVHHKPFPSTTNTFQPFSARTVPSTPKLQTTNPKPQTPNRTSLSIFWFRRDLRLHDNNGLYHALQSGYPVLPVFIFDSDILEQLDDKNDRRVSFIHQAIEDLQSQLLHAGTSLDVRYGSPLEVIKQLIKDYQVHAVYTNHDYEPYATKRDQQIKDFLEAHGIGFRSFKDQVIFEKDEIVKDNGDPYAVFTPYSKKWISNLHQQQLSIHDLSPLMQNFLRMQAKPIPSIAEIGFIENKNIFSRPVIDEGLLRDYDKTRDTPCMPTSLLGVHLRFGTISIRQLVKKSLELNQVFLKELIWREFFMQVLWHHPSVVTRCFKKEYEKIRWRNNEKEFQAWCNGQTGYPLVDAGMRELNATGFMHNRVRMVTASFLVKHLLVDWRWGETWFAQKLLDYELASNNGNWQWAAGCGCDAAPYFRIFNPVTQAKKFDPAGKYINKWIPELNSFSYPQPIVNHEMARKRCLSIYSAHLNIEY